MTTLEWKHAGAERQEAVPVPGISIGNYDYTLVFDEKRKKTVYLFASDYGVRDAWTFDGRTWEPSPGGSNDGSGDSSERHSYFDPTRGGVMVWGVEYDSNRRQYVPLAAIADEKGIRKVETTGEAPRIRPEDLESFSLSSNIPLTVTFDRRRDVAVCLTRCGIWELDANGAWSRRSDGAGIIPQEWHSDVGGVFDPLRKACLFWVQGRGKERYQHIFLGWDGTTITRLETTGLPKACVHFNDTFVDFASHPTHGVVAFVSGVGLYAFDGKAWSELGKSTNVPPQRSQSHFAYDPTRDLYVQGPGKHDGDPGGFDHQRVFYVLRNGAWEEQGIIVRPSIFKQISGAMHAAVGSSWHAVLRHMRTLVWEKEAWCELVDETRAQAICPKTESVRDITATPNGLVAVTSLGSVLTLDGSTWKLTAKRSPLWKDRSEFVLGYDEGANRLVAWGGEVKNRKSNDTLFFAGEKWTLAKTASPQPKDFKDKDNYVDYAMIYDSALGRLVRFGYSEVAVLEGEVWKPFTPRKYRELLGTRALGHLPAHDRATGETLLVNVDGARVVRFDLAECKEVAAFAVPAHVAAYVKLKREPLSNYFGNIVYVPETRTLEVQHKDDAAERYSISLASAFEAAREMGARKLLGAVMKRTAAPNSTRLYFVDKSSSKFWFCTVDGKFVMRAWGRIGDRGDTKKESFKSADEAAAAATKLVAVKKSEGYVDAAALSMTTLERLGTQTSSELSVGSKAKSDARQAVSRVGGLPSGVPLAKWPKCGGTSMGFLFQLVTGSQLKKHAGLAVFCTTDGSATDGESRNRVVLLTKADLAKTPLSSVPEKVRVLKPTLITIEDALPEINEALVEVLAERDPAMGAAFDRFQANAKVQEPASSKIGGAPCWVQDDATPKKYRFVAQLDFDSLNVNDEWEDAGLMGAIFVFVSDDEKRAIAFWQYT